MLKNKPKNKHGFTLTELIIVIVIIGILAAVLIPTLTNYVNRAKLSNDKSNARNLTMLLSLEAIDENVDYFDANYVINFAIENGYDLKASAKNYYYWYDYTNNSVIVEALHQVSTSADTIHPILYNPFNNIRAVDNTNKLFLNQGSDNLSTAVELVVNFLDRSKEYYNTNEDSNITDINTAMTSLFNEFVNSNKLNDTVVFNHLNNYNPSNTIYVDDSGAYPIESSYNITNMVFSNKTTSIPESLSNITITSNSLNTIYLPVNIQPNNIFKNFIQGISATNSQIVVTNNQQSELINQLKTELGDSFKLGVKQETKSGYNKQLIELNFEVTLNISGVTITATSKFLSSNEYTVGCQVTKADESNSKFYSNLEYQEGYYLNEDYCFYNDSTTVKYSTGGTLTLSNNGYSYVTTDNPNTTYTNNGSIYLKAGFYPFGRYYSDLVDESDPLNKYYKDEKGLLIDDNSIYSISLNKKLVNITKTDGSSLFVKGYNTPDGFINNNNANVKKGILVKSSNTFYADDKITFTNSELLSNEINSTSGYVDIKEKKSISIIFTDPSGNPIMTEGSSFTVKYYSTLSGKVCEVLIFDKFGVLYAKGTLKYNLK